MVYGEAKDEEIQAWMIGSAEPGVAVGLLYIICKYFNNNLRMVETTCGSTKITNKYDE